MSDETISEFLFEELQKLREDLAKSIGIVQEVALQLSNMMLEYKGMVTQTRGELALNTKRNKKRKAIAKAIVDYYEV